MVEDLELLVARRLVLAADELPWHFFSSNLFAETDFCQQLSQTTHGVIRRRSDDFVISADRRRAREADAALESL